MPWDLYPEHYAMSWHIRTSSMPLVQPEPRVPGAHYARGDDGAHDCALGTPAPLTHPVRQEGVPSLPIPPLLPLSTVLEYDDCPC